jgi:signal transduction histidine kinase
VIQRESGRINGTVEQFLEYSRPRPLDRRPTPIRAFLDDVTASAVSVAAPRGVHIVAGGDSSLEGFIDPAQLAQALDNLLRNAIQVSPAGSSVWIDARRADGGLAIDVRDEGPGIPADVLPRIFDLYFTTRAEGTGVGLAVAQQIVTAHGGTIEVDSIEGRGTTMSVRLPGGEADHG